MLYEDAFAALKNRDYPTAVRLLEEAARNAGFTSDLINHAYTLALYHAGAGSQLASAAFNIAGSVLRQDPASAMDYFQRAIRAGLDPERTSRIAEIFQQWAEPRRASAELRVDRVAHVIGLINPGDDRTRYLKMLISSMAKQGVESSIFTTESTASWFFNAENAPLSQPSDMGAVVNIASVDGDFLERATRIADALRRSGIAVGLFHSGLEEQITARTACMRPIPFQVLVDHGTAMQADLFDARIHLSARAARESKFPGPATWIAPASDIETRIAQRNAATRQDLGLESAKTISAGFGDLNAAGAGYLRALSEIMKRFPQHFHLFAGPGSVKRLRSNLHTEGVLPRVRFLGPVPDPASLLNVVDLCLAPYPGAEDSAILDAMGAGRPVVVWKQTSSAELVGMRELTATGDGEYIQIADGLLRNPDWRAHVAQALRARFRAEFHPDALGQRYREFLESAISSIHK